jgi:hypothetical protein
MTKEALANFAATNINHLAELPTVLGLPNSRVHQSCTFQAMKRRLKMVQCPALAHRWVSHPDRADSGTEMIMNVPPLHIDPP